MDVNPWAAVGTLISTENTAYMSPIFQLSIVSVPSVLERPSHNIFNIYISDSRSIVLGGQAQPSAVAAFSRRCLNYSDKAHDCTAATTTSHCFIHYSQCHHGSASTRYEPPNHTIRNTSAVNAGTHPSRPPPPHPSNNSPSQQQRPPSSSATRPHNHPHISPRSSANHSCTGNTSPPYAPHPSFWSSSTTTSRQPSGQGYGGN